MLFILKIRIRVLLLNTKNIIMVSRQYTEKKQYISTFLFEKNVEQMVNIHPRHGADRLSYLI